MKAFICDHCQKTGAPDSYDLVPIGWFSLYERTSPQKGALTFCGLHCLTHHLQLRVLETTDTQDHASRAVRTGAPITEVLGG